MEDLEYCVPKKNELLDFFYVILALSFLFAISFLRFSPNYSGNFADAFIVFFIFFCVMFFFKQLIMRLVALHNGFEIWFKQSVFDRFGPRSHDTLSYWVKEAEKKVVEAPVEIAGKVKHRHYNYKAHKLSGIPASIISVFIYILTLGFFIYPNMWSYGMKAIPHRFIGTSQRYEQDQRWFLFRVHVTDWRLSKVYMAGFMFYFIFAYILKVLFGDSSDFYFWFIFATYWIALFTMVPFPGSEGFDFWRRNTLGWLLTLSVLVVGMVSVLIFDDFWFMVLSMVLAFVVILFFRLWRILMHNSKY